MTTWTQTTNNTAWREDAEYLILNDVFETYEVSGLNYDTSGVEYEYRVERTDTNPDVLWDETITQTSWRNQ